MISVHVDDVYMAGRPDTLENVRELIKLRFNMKEYSKVISFLGVYYEWGHNNRVPCAKFSMDEDFNKLVGGYKKLLEMTSRCRKPQVLLAQLFARVN